MPEPPSSASSNVPVPVAPERRPETARRVQLPKRPNNRYVAVHDRPTGGVGYSLRPAGYELVATLAAEGQPDVAIAKRLGMDPSTFTDLKKRDDALRAALSTGKGELETELTHLLLKQARDGNLVAAIYLTKTRCGWREQGPADGAAPVAIQVQINAPLSADEFLKVVGPLPPEPEEPAP